MKVSMKAVLAEGMVDIPPTTPNPKTPQEQLALVNQVNVNSSPGDTTKQDGQPEKQQPGIRWEFTDEIEHHGCDEDDVHHAPAAPAMAGGRSMRQKQYAMDEGALQEMLDLGDYHSKKLEKHKKEMKSNRNNPEKHNYHKARVGFHAGVLEKIDKVPAGTYASEQTLVDEVIIDNVLNEVAPPGMEGDVAKTKSAFVEQYGEEKGVKIAYATAWKKYKDNKNEELMLTESEFWGRKPNPGEVDVPRKPIKTFTPPASDDLHSALSMAHRTGKSLKLYFSDGEHVIIEPSIAREILAKKHRDHINSAKTDDSLTELLCDVMEC